ncbi:MAG: hypothetical protein KAR42_14350 [candidate division Zixibacteria bacterium]|nr:hypothetical protein [candidate division Zixibacteria bacterium]
MTQITTFEQLITSGKELVKNKRIARAAFLGLPDSSFIKAILQAESNMLVKSIVLCDKEQLSKVLLEAKMDKDSVAVIHSDSLSEACAKAVNMVAEGQIDFLITSESNLETPAGQARSLMDILADSGFITPKKTACHLAIFEHEKYPRFLMLSDAFISVEPGLVGKMGIINLAVEAAHSLGVEIPKVAVTAAVEVVYPAMEVTKDAAVLAKMSDRKQIKGCLIDGPLSMDCATVPEVARDKGVVSEVAGVADILIAPNIETGNGIYKAMSLVSKAKTGGVIIGGKCPIAFSANCDNRDNNYYSIVLGGFLSLQKV